MYKTIVARPTKISRNESIQGETIEEKIERVVNNQEPITDGAPIIYTERMEGVRPEHNIRTDRWEVAIDAMSAVDRTHQAKRKDKNDAKIVDIKGKDSGAEPIQGAPESTN